jgi:hypothetical protein
VVIDKDKKKQQQQQEEQRTTAAGGENSDDGNGTITSPVWLEVAKVWICHDAKLIMNWTPNALVQEASVDKLIDRLQNWRRRSTCRS